MGQIQVYDNIQELAERLIFLLQKIIDETPEREFTNIAVSGGSTPQLIFDYISSNSENIKWNKTRFFWVDERCVSPEDEGSNYHMTRLHLFDKIDIAEKQIFRIIGEADPALEAIRYSKIITDNLPNANGLPRFDLVLLGIGGDGHTASIFTGDTDLFNSEKICESTVHPQSRQKRITLTGKVINNAGYIVFLVTGSEKAIVVAKILQDDERVNLPASFVKPFCGKLYWFLDKLAAKLLMGNL